MRISPPCLYLLFLITLFASSFFNNKNKQIMETQTATTNKGARKEVLTIFTEQVIEKLKKGIVPWRVSWIEAGIPENLISGNAYRSINRVLLASLGYQRNLFLTSKQLKAIGGTLIPDERPHIIGYLSNTKNDAGAGDGVAVPEETSGTKGPMKLRYYTVFNIAQCAIPPETLLPPVVLEEDPIQETVEIKSKDQKCAYYDPLRDFVNLPKDSFFETKEARSEAHFHQLMHSTGHHSRLNRRDLVQMSEFGYDAFSHEELVAEIGASYLLSHYGMTLKFEPTEDYLAGWIRKFEKDKWLMFSAAQQAEKAINFLFIGELEPGDMKIE
jgi:antirestriction protein ArdC